MSVQLGDTRLPERFWEKVEPCPVSGCWVWVGALDSTGYGRIKWGDRIRPAHRIAYEQVIGPVSDDLHCDHLCRVRSCVNPNHIEPVTQRENLLRGATVVARCASTTHCPRGHVYSDSNTRWTTLGRKRQCRICTRNRDRIRVARRSGNRIKQAAAVAAFAEGLNLSRDQWTASHNIKGEI